MQKKQAYVDQSASALRFQLLTGPVDTNQFTVLCEDSLNISGLRLRAGIIGASHFLTVTHVSGNMLNEIFACTDVVAEGPRIIAGPLGDMSTEVKSVLWEVVRYSFVPQTLSWRDGLPQLEVLKQRIALGRNKSDEIALAFEFPKLEAEDAAPLTLVWVGTEPDRLLVRTAHCYPNEGNIVFTESEIQQQESSHE